MDVQLDLERAEQAQSILEHPLFSEAFEELEHAYIEAWRSSRSGAVEEHERLHTALNFLGAIRVHLESVIAGGALARADLELITAPKDIKIN